MLQLNPDQTQALRALKRTRDLRRLGQSLALAFPDVPARVADRYDALIEHGVQRGAAHGLDHAACLGRYLACWFMLGAEFEARPEFSWAQDILAAPSRPQGSKVFQLCQRTREELARLSGTSGAAQSSLPGPAAFTTAIAGLDAALQPCGEVGSLRPPLPVQLGAACDIDALDLRLHDPAAGRQPHRYQLEPGTSGQWRRLPVSTAPGSVTVSAAPAAGRMPAPGLPARMHLLGPGTGHEPARLRVRTRVSHCCDSAVHPLVSHHSPSGLAQWRGPLAADLTLSLFPPATEPPLDDAPLPRIAAEGAPELSLLSLGSCGLRDKGAALGEQTTELAVYPGDQHLMVWRREAGPAMTWPEADSPPPVAAAARCRVERDGLPLEASRWQAGLEDLDRQLGEGLARLATAWERESGVSQGRVHAEPAVFSGTAGLTWGWADHPDGPAHPPYYRLLGALDLVICHLQLRLEGELHLEGARSRVHLHCSGRETLHLQFERGPAQADLLAVIKPAQVAFRHPFVLQLETLAQTAPAAVLDAQQPVAGALVGTCGLRPRATGPGLQWYFTLAIEPVATVLHLQDPLLGRQTAVHPLLPAMKLLDWSLG